MDVDDDTVSMSSQDKAQNLRRLRKAIEDMEGLDEETEEFLDEWFADNVGFFHDIRKSFPDFLLIINSQNLKSVEEAKIVAEENASHLEYEMEMGGTLDVSAYWRFCIAVETIVQGCVSESETGLEDLMMSVTIPALIK